MSNSPRFINRTTNQNLNVAFLMADALLSGPTSKLHLMLTEKHEWKYGTNMDGYGVSETILRGPVDVNVFTYRPWNRWTRAIAMTNGDGAIHFNIYKIQKMNTLDMVGSLLHEYSHLAGFSHSGNYKNKDKCLYSVPYWLSENVARFM